jgi:hypothetical protein
MLKKLPVEYTANRKAWMMSSIFRLAATLEKRFIRQKRKTALIICNCPAHSVHVKFTAIKLILLPMNTTSTLQPCDQGIIQNSKFHYKKVLRKHLTAIQAK